MNQIDQRRWKIYLKDIKNVESKMKILDNSMVPDWTRKDIETRLKTIMKDSNHMLEKC